MTVSQMAQILHLNILAMPHPEREVDGAYAGDLLSWVMGRASEGQIWMTVMTNLNVLAVATLVDTSGVIVCEESNVDDELIQAAVEKGVNLFQTDSPIYETCVAISKLIS